MIVNRTVKYQKDIVRYYRMLKRFDRYVCNSDNIDYIDIDFTNN
jgi:hypothetical protein